MSSMTIKLSATRATLHTDGHNSPTDGRTYEVDWRKERRNFAAMLKARCCVQRVNRGTRQWVEE